MTTWKKVVFCAIKLMVPIPSIASVPPTSTQCLHISMYCKIHYGDGAHQACKPPPSQYENHVPCSSVTKFHVSSIYALPPSKAQAVHMSTIRIRLRFGHHTSKQ